MCQRLAQTSSPGCEGRSAERVPLAEGGRPGMARVVELEAGGAIVAYIIGVASGVICMVAAGIRIEEKVARRRNLARQRGVTLYDDATSPMTRSARWLNTGRDHHS